GEDAGVGPDRRRRQAPRAVEAGDRGVDAGVGGGAGRRRPTARGRDERPNQEDEASFPGHFAPMLPSRRTNGADPSLLAPLPPARGGSRADLAHPPVRALPSRV